MFARFLNWLNRKRNSARSLGERGEHVAERYLRRRGLTIVGRRERDTLGEIDLVAVDQRTVVFVEVKTRRSHRYGHPAEAVDSRKQYRISRSAAAYLKRHRLLEHAVRFDIVAVTWPCDNRSPVVEHFPNAFESPDVGQFFF